MTTWTLKVEAFDASDKQVPGTGGTYFTKLGRNPSKTQYAIAKRKVAGMIRRGYFADVVRFDVYADNTLIGVISNR